MGVVAGLKHQGGGRQSRVTEGRGERLARITVRQQPVRLVSEPQRPLTRLPKAAHGELSSAGIAPLLPVRPPLIAPMLFVTAGRP